jgi:hypothetical protein
MVKTVLNHRLRLDIAVQRLDEEMTHELEALQEAEQNNRGHGRRLLEANIWYLVKEVVVSWPLKVIERE